MKLSVVTVCYNAQDTLEKTIISVLNQNYENIEFIIIDGGSSDNTLAIITKYKDKIDYFISEEDKGIYHAMDKGIKASTGDVLYFLNSGDEFFDDSVVKKIMDAYKKTGTDIIFGDLYYIANEKNYLEIEIFEPNTVYKQNYINNKMMLYDTNIHHQTIFYKRKIFETSSLYREDINYGSDYMLNVDAICKYNYKAEYINETIAKFLLGGVSTAKKTALIDYETARSYIREHYFKNSLSLYIYKSVCPMIYNFLSKYCRSLLRLYDNNKNIKSIIDTIIQKFFCWSLN